MITDRLVAPPRVYLALYGLRALHQNSGLILWLDNTQTLKQVRFYLLLTVIFFLSLLVVIMILNTLTWLTFTTYIFSNE